MCKPHEMGCFQRADYTLIREGEENGGTYKRGEGVFGLLLLAS
jgi:hypothetical protein